MTIWKSLLLITLTLILNTGCERNTQSPSDAPTASTGEVAALAPCSLITREEAEAVLGTLREEPTAGAGTAQGSSCMYASSANVNATVTPHNAASFEANQSDRAIPLTGLGEAAFNLSDEGSGEAYVWARKGDKALAVHVSGGTGEGSPTKRLEMGKALAEKALARL